MLGGGGCSRGSGSWSGPSARSASRGSRPCRGRSRGPRSRCRTRRNRAPGCRPGPARGPGRRRGRDTAGSGSSCRPRIISRAPPPWSPFLVFSERMMQVCFSRLAIFGISSEMWMPGTTVGMARNGPAGRRARLGVPRLELARAAGQPEQDHALLLLLQLAGQGGRLEHVQHRSCRPRTPPRRRPSCRGSGGGRGRGRASRRSCRVASGRPSGGLPIRVVECEIGSVIEPELGARQQRPDELAAAFDGPVARGCAR